MKRLSAFSLPELLVVMAIIALLSALALSAFNSVGRGREMEVAAIQISDALALARQMAISKNRPTEVHFFRHPGRSDPAEAIRSIQVFEVDDNGASQPMGKPTHLPDSVAISDQIEWSSVFAPGILDQLPATTAPGVGAVSSIHVLRFRASGRTGIANLNGNYFLSVLPVSPSTSKNFATIQIDPLTGRTRIFRP